MKRIAILAALVAVAACHKAEVPATSSTAPATPPPAAETTTTAPAAKYVPPPDVSVANAPVPTAGLSLWLRADSGVTAGADGKVSAWAVEGSPVKAVAPMHRRSSRRWPRTPSGGSRPSISTAGRRCSRRT